MSDKDITMKQMTSRDQLGNFVLLFAHLNNDVLFGEVWDQDTISNKIKPIVMIISQGITDNSSLYHLQTAKKNGATHEEIVAVITHATM
ncbi:carboxymuconolactone decarboxylase family protein [Atopobium sp. oral taxon 416]|uniref:carboxymuconolactone decarboxylase family protein n=1 Tax=Atopobium sp. oral taxon 416 TaxID=712157 RepID=UPI0020135D41|nr:carboxymuconolactone decarboxylase family protein [Atopobium sp. oral taxon 416]